MTMEATGWVLCKSTSKGYDRLVLLAMSDSVNNDYGDIYVGDFSSIAKWANTTEKQVEESIGKLIRKGELIYLGDSTYRIIMR